jgi:hypothetical protein
MVPFTIFHRLSSLGSGGGMNAATIPPIHGTKRTAIALPPDSMSILSFTVSSLRPSVTPVTWIGNVI